MGRVDDDDDDGHAAGFGVWKGTVRYGPFRGTARWRRGRVERSSHTYLRQAIGCDVRPSEALELEMVVCSLLASWKRAEGEMAERPCGVALRGWIVRWVARVRTHLQLA